MPCAGAFGQMIGFCIIYDDDQLEGVRHMREWRSSSMAATRTTKGGFDSMGVKVDLSEPFRHSPRACRDEGYRYVSSLPNEPFMGR